MQRGVLIATERTETPCEVKSHALKVWIMGQRTERRRFKRRRVGIESGVRQEVSHALYHRRSTRAVRI